MAKTLKHIKTQMTQEEIDLLINFIVAMDNLSELRKTVSGWIGTPEDTIYMNCQRAIWKYSEKTGRALNAKVGLYAGNVWD